MARHGQRWEVKICKGRGLTINQNAQIRGENFIVVNYSNYSSLRRVWILWEAEDRFFTPRKPNLNLRTILLDVAGANIEVIFDAAQKDPRQQRAEQLEMRPLMAKAEVPTKSQRKKTPA